MCLVGMTARSPPLHSTGGIRLGVPHTDTGWTPFVSMGDSSDAHVQKESLGGWSTLASDAEVLNLWGMTQSGSPWSFSNCVVSGISWFK